VLAHSTYFSTTKVYISMKFEKPPLAKVTLLVSGSQPQTVYVKLAVHWECGVN